MLCRRGRDVCATVVWRACGAEGSHPERHKNSAQELWYTKVVQYLHMVSTMGNNHTASCAIVV